MWRKRTYEDPFAFFLSVFSCFQLPLHPRLLQFEANDKKDSRQVGQYLFEPNDVQYFQLRRVAIHETVGKKLAFEIPPFVSDSYTF